MTGSRAWRRRPSTATRSSQDGRSAGDWKWHQKTLNYDLMNIPRDPGNSAAYDLDIGLATTSGRATFGLDVIYERERVVAPTARSR